MLLWRAHCCVLVLCGCCVLLLLVVVVCSCCVFLLCVVVECCCCVHCFVSNSVSLLLYVVVFFFCVADVLLLC